MTMPIQSFIYDTTSDEGTFLQHLSRSLQNFQKKCFPRATCIVLNLASSDLNQTILCEPCRVKNKYFTIENILQI